MRHTVVLLALAACAPPRAALPQTAAPPPALHGSYLLRGAPVVVSVTGLPAGADVGLAGTTTASGPRACPPQIAPLCLDLATPIRLLGATRADARGEARLTLTVPTTLTVPAVRLQAVAPTAGLVSNAGTFRLLDPGSDHDGDGLPNRPEHDAGLDPLSADSDGDGLDDGLELAIGADPHTPDSDGGGVEDGAEVDAGFDPLDPSDDRCAGGGCVVDCAGQLGGPATLDLCGVCDADPDNDCCAGAGQGDDADQDGVIACHDCDDEDATRGPGFPELCDGLDNDCDGQPGLYEGDVDRDGGRACVDCDDGNPTRGPGFPELCDGLDNDCDGGLPAAELDGDGDGLMACRECDDSTASRRPGLPEACDGLDNDCDPATAAAATLVRRTRVPGPMPASPAYAHPNALRVGVTLPAGVILDMDMYLSATHGSLQDTDVWLFPPQGPGVLLANDEGGFVATLFDDDAPRSITEPFTSFVGRVRPETPLAPLIGQPSGGTWTLDISDGTLSGTGQLHAWRLDVDMQLTGVETDADRDGVLACHNDCDDSRPDVGPGRPELCDGVDNDCDGVVPAHELDVDGDGVFACSGDCDDTRWEVRPGAVEVCDGLDNDCNSGTRAAGEVDNDGDSWLACLDDCDDRDPDSYPGAPEICDRVDSNCDGYIPYVEFDTDHDGWSICEGDCGPDTQVVYPGSLAWSSTGFIHRDNVMSWDYNCDGTETRQWETLGSPCGGAFWICSYTAGWSGATVPVCGEQRVWYETCPPDLFCSVGVEVYRLQACQ